jgi:enolase
VLPVPMMNIINGGEHADNPIDIQEFMIMPVGADAFAEAVRMGAEVFHTLKKALKAAGHNTASATRAASRRTSPRRREALDFIMKASRRPATRPGEDVVLALDCAATEFFKRRRATSRGEGKSAVAERDGRLPRRLVRRYPIVSIEDGMAEDDWDGWKR